MSCPKCDGAPSPRGADPDPQAVRYLLDRISRLSGAMHDVYATLSSIDEVYSDGSNATRVQGFVVQAVAIIVAASMDQRALKIDPLTGR
jgi:hypothetical protein